MKNNDFRIGIDVGGTFTDLVLVDGRTNRASFGKELTSHDDPSRSMLQGLQRLLDANGIAWTDVGNIVHATTLVTNAIIERKGAKVGLITTRGFRDVLEIGNETRYELYDLFFEKPAPLVSRQLRQEVSERIGVNGDVITPLDEDDVAAATEVLREYGVEAVAVCLMHGYRNPSHEKRIAAQLRDLLPGVPVTLSSDIAPVIREYERANTASGNAYVQPVVEQYLTELETGLSHRGFDGAVHLMLSAGGLTTLGTAKKQPIHLIESGPAAGAIAAGYFSRLTDTPNLISFDMGGTTAKMCLLRDGEPERSSEFEAARVQRFKKGSGLPLKVPVIDLIEIGAGGGSIARVDGMGLLKVGPESASSTPGPVCYNRGGTEPTVTDSDLVLGYLSPDYFLGGELKLDLAAVHQAIGDRLAAPLGMDVSSAAAGVHRIVNETMASATRMYLTERGEDPSRYTLLAFGGAGPVHAYGLAKSLGIAKIVVPPGAGVMSALGLLTAAPACDVARSYISDLSAVDWNIVNRLFADMEGEASALLVAAGVSKEEIVLTRSADMRFIGQGFEIPTVLPEGKLGPDLLADIEARFIHDYAVRFGRRVDGVGVEALTWRLTASIPRREAQLAFATSGQGGDARKGQRRAYFEGKGFIDCAVFERSKLAAGATIAGPAIIEERESTIVAGPNTFISVDGHFNVVIEIRETE
ncbi:hydantoinase/oxoprolinase family protein [Rhizobium giardinii]|uniref:N-methylhydantoinase A n=1 Tax=Rhizobium giardinii TaxID=56731 RepID=A0A7W8UG78_9HYPH|nr:hydantoinase/oxoprolinase family protein [Rhizobium giardinii]MBB5538784.1 N-methylhydantoinase A [Rhizobium giardinii]